MKMKISTMLALIALLLIAIVLLGCSREGNGKSTKEEYLRKRIDRALIQLPFDATNIVSLGNGWYTFELNGDKFMGRSHYYRQWFGRYRFNCITQVK